MKRIYFDNSATTSVDEKVLSAMLPYFRENFGNAGSLHTYGQVALTAVDEAREKIAYYLGCRNQEIIFTSGATESNNIAIQGVVRFFKKQNKPIHIITSKIEHPAVLEVFRAMAKLGDVEATYLDVDEDGVIKMDQLKKAIKSNTVLISIMYANNEVGAIQPLVEISKLVVSEREKRGNSGLPIYLHTDAVQAFNYLNCNVEDLGVDMLSFSGHKIYAPKGIGGLYLRAGVKIEPLMYGGHHEYGLRPSTLNVPGIVGLGEAVDLIAKEKERNIKQILKIKNKIIRGLEKITESKFNCDKEKQLPNIINISFYKAEGESILMMLDIDGVAVSTGSACSSGSLEPSHVLTAMGRIPEWSHGSVRISIGKNNKEADVAPLLKSIVKAVKRLREMAPSN